MTLRGHLKESLQRNGGLILLSDFDGTLAPIGERPEAARLPRRTRRILARLARHPRSRDGIVSGRSLRALQRLGPVPNAAHASCHGLGTGESSAVAPARHAGAEEPMPRRRDAESASPARRSRLTVSLHFRLADRSLLPALRSIVSDLSQCTPSLEVLPGKKVLELRPGVAWGKGEAARVIRDLLAKSLRPRSPATLYLGDDETDEEAFRTLRGKALCVAVGRRRTRAVYRLRNPAAVQALLAWLAAIRTGKPPVKR